MVRRNTLSSVGDIPDTTPTLQAIMPQVNQKPHIHQMVICANIFVRKNGKYLLLKRSPEKIFAPDVTHPIGGKVDANENPFLAAQREVFEEAGIRVKNIKLEAVFLEVKPIPNMPENWLIFHFSADYKQGKIKNTPEGKLIFLTKSEIFKQKLFPSVKLALEHILNPKDGTVFATFYFSPKGKIYKKRLGICAL